MSTNTCKQCGKPADAEITRLTDDNETLHFCSEMCAEQHEVIAAEISEGMGDLIAGAAAFAAFGKYFKPHEESSNA